MNARQLIEHLLKTARGCEATLRTDNEEESDSRVDALEKYLDVVSAAEKLVSGHNQIMDSHHDHTICESVWRSDLKTLCESLKALED